MIDTEEKFRNALATVLKHEGGLVDNPDDPGGITNYGISLRTLSRLGHVDNDHDGAADYDFNGDGSVDANDVCDAGPEDVENFYYYEFWNKYSYHKLPFLIAAKVMDLSVNMGPKQAHKILQRALIANGLKLKDDGILGNITFTLAENCLEARSLPAIRSEAAGFYRLLVAVNPKAEQWREGWLRRAYS
tara:strand:+ start:12766 stop:13332 length:567 start_codon:yes stop_codon:yes gene_type:complete